MSPRDLVYVGHMLDMARKAVNKTQGLSREAYDADENLPRAGLVELEHLERERGVRGTGDGCADLHLNSSGW